VTARLIEVRQSLASRVTSPWKQGLRELHAVDVAVYEAVARTPTPTLDGPIRRLSSSANKSRLWLGIAAAIALTGGRRGRRAALQGVIAIGITSAAVNLGVKTIADRPRPERDVSEYPVRHVAMPRSTSFPSGHAASAFAFAYAISRDLPLLAVPIRLLAGAVAYSRVHTGVHYPGDVVIGSIIGAGTAAMVGAAFDHAKATRERASKRSEERNERGAEPYSHVLGQRHERAV
jgi:membrane-associated phospholipid phosphatase